MSTHKTYMIYNEHTYDLYEQRPHLRSMSTLTIYDLLYDLQWAHLQSMIYNEQTYDLDTYNLWFTMSTFKSINDNEHT